VQTVFDAAGGEAGLLALAHAWHERVMADEVVSHAFRHGFDAEHTQRLAAYSAEALGGPSSHSAAYGDEPLTAWLPPAGTRCGSRSTIRSALAVGRRTWCSLRA